MEESGEGVPPGEEGRLCEEGTEDPGVGKAPREDQKTHTEESRDSTEGAGEKDRD